MGACVKSVQERDEDGVVYVSDGVGCFLYRIFGLDVRHRRDRHRDNSSPGSRQQRDAMAGDADNKLTFGIHSSWAELEQKETRCWRFRRPCSFLGALDVSAVGSGECDATQSSRRVSLANTYDSLIPCAGIVLRLELLNDNYATTMALDCCPTIPDDAEATAHIMGPRETREGGSGRRWSPRLHGKSCQVSPGP